MVRYIKPDSKDDYYSPYSFKVFFAGTIDNGESDDWQKELYCNVAMHDNLVITMGENYVTPEKLNITIFNPRRDEWNPEFSNEDVIEQIKWEQEKLDEADLIVMVLRDDSKSPISLLELGLYGPGGKMIVFCSDKFYRYNNVKLTCEKYLIPFEETTDLYRIGDAIVDLFYEWENGQ